MQPYSNSKQTYSPYTPFITLGYCYFFASISSICFFFVRYGILFRGFRVRWWDESLFLTCKQGGFSLLDRGADKGGGILIRYTGQSRYWSACFKAIVRGDWWSLKVAVANAHSLEFKTGTPFFGVRGTLSVGEKIKVWLETTRWTPRVGFSQIDRMASFITIRKIPSAPLPLMRKWLKKLPSFVIPRRSNLLILISSCPKLISRNRPFRVPLYEQQFWKEGGLSFFVEGKLD